MKNPPRDQLPRREKSKWARLMRKLRRGNKREHNTQNNIEEASKRFSFVFETRKDVNLAPVTNKRIQTREVDSLNQNGLSVPSYRANALIKKR